MAVKLLHHIKVVKDWVFNRKSLHDALITMLN